MDPPGHSTKTAKARIDPCNRIGLGRSYVGTPDVEQHDACQLTDESSSSRRQAIFYQGAEKIISGKLRNMHGLGLFRTIGINVINKKSKGHL